MPRIISNNSNALRVPSKILDDLANLRRFEFVWNEPCAMTYQMPLCGSVLNKLYHRARVHKSETEEEEK
ncbi:hypothetical protein HZH68_013075 [Vespula germanica]|uniref:Uncharacterized protein n=1 Tax=Vespula germanica TaxID=30212 RepID=A0A834JFN1_VESGE|nr:hypothetical protein HZH68_013075 [Vespula germanica]